MLNLDNRVLSFWELLTTVPSSCGQRKSSTTNKDGTRSAYPRGADNFSKWDSYFDEVVEFANKTLVPCYNIKSRITVDELKGYQEGRDAGCEADIETSLEFATFTILKELLRIMGIKSTFTRGIGDDSVILEPDYIWKFYPEFSDEKGFFRVPIEVKPFWSFLVNRRNLASQYASDLRIYGDSACIRGCEQIYGYSSFNLTRYSILTTQHVLYCFKRLGNSQLAVSDSIPLEGIKFQNIDVSVFACWLFILFNAREDGIYSSPNGTPTNYEFSDPEKTIALKVVPRPVLDLYYLRKIRSDQIFFDAVVIGKGAVGTVIPGMLFGTPLIIFKLYDVFHDPSYIETSKKEVETYKTLKSLQGSLIPKFYGYFKYHGVIIIALEDCGKPISEMEYGLFENQIEEGKVQMEYLGVTHNDLKLRDGIYPNILNKDGNIKFIDFHL
jgi:hypothetical protein